MARFDVYQIGDAMVVDVQADILDHFATRIVVPLVEIGQSPSPLKRLHPRFEVAGQTLVLAAHLLGAVPLANLKRTKSHAGGQA